MSIYKAEYDTRLLYSQSYAADEGLFVTTDMFAVMWTYPQAVSATTTRVRLTYIYTKESGAISPVQGILEQWKSEGWTVMDEFCDGYSDFQTSEELRDHMMQMARAFLLGVPLGAEVEGDDSPKGPTPNKTGLKTPRPSRSSLKSRIEKMIKKPVDESDPLAPDEDDIFASTKIVKPKPVKTSGSKDDSPPDDDDGGWI